MSDDLAELRERVEIARADISKLDKMCADHSLTVRASKEQNRDGLSIFLTPTAPVPTRLKVLCGQIVNELRAALDNLACNLAERNGNDPGENTYFPISKTPEIFQTDGYRKMKLLSDADKQTVAELKPYNGGHPHLYALHVADKKRKHQRLSIQSTRGAGAIVGGMPFSSAMKIHDLFIEDEFVEYLHIVPQDGPMEVGTRQLVAHARGVTAPIVPTISIVYEDPAELRGKGLIGTLNEFANSVSSVIDKFG